MSLRPMRTPEVPLLAHKHRRSRSLDDRWHMQASPLATHLARRHPADVRFRPFVVLVVGNIGVGKSTFLQRLAAHSRSDAWHGPRFNAALEPVEEWMNWNGHDLLNLAITKAGIYEALFQLIAMHTHLTRLLDTYDGSASNEIVAGERDISENSEVFAKHHADNGMIDPVVYDSLRGLANDVKHRRQPVDAFIVLTNDVETMHERVLRRDRKSELDGTPVEYLAALQTYYDKLTLDLQAERPTLCLRTDDAWTDDNVQRAARWIVEQRDAARQRATNNAVFAC